MPQSPGVCGVEPNAMISIPDYIFRMIGNADGSLGAIMLPEADR